MSWIRDREMFMADRDMGRLKKMARDLEGDPSIQAQLDDDAMRLAAGLPLEGVTLSASELKAKADASRRAAGNNS